MTLLNVVLSKGSEEKCTQIWEFLRDFENFERLLLITKSFPDCVIKARAGMRPCSCGRH